MALTNLHDMTNQKLATKQRVSTDKRNMENDARTVLLNSKPSSLTLGGSGNTCSTPSVDHFDEVMEGSTTGNGSEANLQDIQHYYNYGGN